MKIALDAMGGDKAPGEIVHGGVLAAEELGVEVALVGEAAAIHSELDRANRRTASVSVVDAPDTIGMAESAAQAVRQKPRSSIVVGLDMVRRGEAAAFVSAGSTGACMAAALAVLDRLPGVLRPALAFVYPSPKGFGLILDVGANPDCKPQFLVQFAQMGSLYMEHVFNTPRPRVGLLSNGEEEEKGNRLVREAHKLLKSCGVNFVGNVEGKDLHRGIADVIVTDGFTGNVVLKLGEGLAEALFDSVKKAVEANLAALATAFIWSPPFLEVYKGYDFREHGGVPLLGVNGHVILAHGRSDARAIKSAVRLAHRMALGRLLDALKAALANSAGTAPVAEAKEIERGKAG